MKNYKRFIMLSMMFVSLPFAITQASDGVGESKNEIAAPVNYAALFPKLAEGFDVLRANYYHDLPSFQDYGEEKLTMAETEDDDPLRFSLLEGLGHIIVASEDLIFGMKARFLGVLGWATDQHIANLDEVQDPVFRYIMKYCEDFLKPVIQEWVNQKNNFGSPFRRSFTPLQWAARSNTPSVVYFLISVGADVNVKDDNNKTALYQACTHNSVVIPLMLLNAGAQVNIDNEDTPVPPSPLHATCLRNAFLVTQLLIDRGANVNGRDSLGCTPLYIASQTNSVQVAQILLASGANVNLQSDNGLTPLHAAALNNRAEAAQLLINAQTDIDALDHQAKTPLHIAVQNHYVDVVNLLISAHADLNAQENDNEYTALHYAVQYNYLDIVKILLDAGASKNIVDRDFQTAAQKAWTPAMQALFQQQ